jgi:hypothetical protein
VCDSEIRRHFPEAWVEGQEDLISAMTNHPKLRLFSVQIVFGPNSSYSIDAKGLAGLRKVHYRTPLTRSGGELYQLLQV